MTNVKIFIEKIDTYSIEHLKANVSRERFLRSLNYKDINRRKSYLLGEFLLREATKSKVDILTKDNGKPYINCKNNYKFNISHSANLVVLAISDKEIGIDIEQVRDRKLSLAQQLHSNEIEYINRQRNKLNAFYTIWTLKESYLKATGEGLNRKLNSFYITPEKSSVDVDYIYKPINNYILSIVKLKD